MSNTTRSRNAIDRVNILGVQVSVTNLEQALHQIEEWVSSREQHYVCFTPAHAIMDARDDPTLLKIMNESGLTTPDGMSIVWILRLRGHRHVGRVYGPDLMLDLCERSVVRGYRHFLFGATDEVLNALDQRLQSAFPGIKIIGSYSPPFRPVTVAEDRAIVDAINGSGADIVWVGLSSPKQDLWMAEHRAYLDVPVLLGVGAAFDFLSGTKPQAPRWIQRSGFEWLFRFWSEPIRLWPRYRRYPLFVLLVGLQILGLRTYEAD